MSGIGGRTVDPADKRALLLDAAERAFLRLGHGDTTIGAIAGEAGVTRPTVYAYFPSKDAVFGALVDRVRGEFLDLQERADTSSPRETIRSTLTAYLDVYTRRVGILTIVAHQALRDPAMRRLRTDIHARAGRRHARFLRRLIEQGRARPSVDPDLVAEAITGVVLRFAEELSADPARRDELAEALIALYVDLTGLE